MSKSVKTLAERLAAVEAVDAVGVAVKIAQAPDPLRFAMAASAIEMVAMAKSLVAFEAVAADTYQLLAHIDALDDLLRVSRSAPLPYPAERVAALKADITTIGEAVANALQALGYGALPHASQPEETHEQKDQGAGS